MRTSNLQYVVVVERLSDNYEEQKYRRDPYFKCGAILARNRVEAEDIAKSISYEEGYRVSVRIRVRIGRGYVMIPLDDMKRIVNDYSNDASQVSQVSTPIEPVNYKPVTKRKFSKELKRDVKTVTFVPDNKEVQ